MGHNALVVAKGGQTGTELKAVGPELKTAAARAPATKHTFLIGR